ncbi:MAG: phosphatidylserine decarboxylase family protein [Gemmatimonadota bacterium]|nr:MAG: phosphatidylserine decarboxylase family protein [Gemmatimonadota bacterium]
MSRRVSENHRRETLRESVRIAPEGHPFVIAGFTALVVLLGLAWIMEFGIWWTLPAVWAPVAFWIPWFFRDPDRRGPRGESLIVAPADGRVVAISDVEEPEFMQGPARKISIFMNVFNVHVNRHPVDGVVRYRHYRAGKFINATLDKASTDNEQCSIGVDGRKGKLLVRQIAGLVARRIVTDPDVGDQIRQGERLGLIRFGSRLDTFVPLEAEVRVGLGEKTLAGITVLAEWPT